MPKRAPANPLAARMNALGIDANELAEILARRHTPDEILDWYAGDAEPDADARVLLRVLDDDADALRRVKHLRRTYQGDLRGAGMTYAGIEGVPYGTRDTGKVTGGVPS